MTPKEKQGSQACSSGLVVAFPLSFPSPHASSHPGATCTRWGEDMAFLSVSRTRDLSSRTPSHCPYCSHSSLLHLHPKTHSWAQSMQPEMGAVSAVTVGFTTSCYCSFTAYSLCANICGHVLCYCGYTCIYVSSYPSPKAQGHVRPVKR